MTPRGRKIVNMVLAVLVAIAAWVFVIINYDPMTDITYSDVPVSFTGEEALAERGLAVVQTSVSGLSVTLSQKRVDASRIGPEDITVLADLSECVAGDNRVDLKISGPEGTTVLKADKAVADVSVGRAKRDVRPIKVMYKEPEEENAELITFDLSNTEAEVVCTQDRLDSIETVAAMLDYEDVTDTVKSYTVDLVALDKEGNVIPHVLITPEEISLDACAGFTKTVSLSVPVKNTQDDYYERKYTVPERMVIKGSLDDIDNIGTVRAHEVDISGIYEDTELPIEYNLPEGIYVADKSKGQMIKVTVSEKKTEDETE